MGTNVDIVQIEWNESERKLLDRVGQKT